jgi:hypothetical protein
MLAPAFGQHLFSFGAKGGIPLTDAFADETMMGVDTDVHSYSDTKYYVIGPFVEFGLPLGFSVEADFFYHPLNLAVDYFTIPLGTVHTSTDIQSWEFPMLAKYHFLHTPIVKPFVGAGPIFRSVGQAGFYLSNDGFSLAGGVEIKILRVRVLPEIRYARWGQDAPQNFTTYPSNRNQAEFLLGLGF